MSDLITVGSRAKATIRISAPDAAAKSGEVTYVTLNGAGSGVEGVTRGVDAGLFHAWLDSEKERNTALSKMVYEIASEEPKAAPAVPHAVGSTE